MRTRLLFLAVTTMLLLSLTACSFRDEEAERTPDVDFYIQYASERFDVPADEISVVYFQKGTYYQNYNFFARRMEPKIIVPPVARLEWGGKTVSFSYPRYSDIDYYDTTYLRDDYYYDELYEGVRQYFLDWLEVKDVIVLLDSRFASHSSEERASLPDDYVDHFTDYVCYGISRYIASHDVTEVTTDVVEDLLDWVGDEEIGLLVELAGDDPEVEIRALIDNLVVMDRRYITATVISQLDGIEVYRKTPDPYAYEGFDRLRIDGINYQDIGLSDIRKADGDPSEKWGEVEYNGYIYSRSKLLQAQEQTDAESDEEPVEPVSEHSEGSSEEPVAPEQPDTESGEEPTEE